MPKYSILIAEFPFGGNTRAKTSRWIMQTAIEMHKDPRFDEEGIFHIQIDDTPVTTSRNRAIEVAEYQKADYLLMIDSDVEPDIATDQKANAKPFWKSSWEWILEHPGIVAAPYCGPPPVENVYAFRWTNKETESANPSFHIEQYSRHEAAGLTGIRPAAALATGLILLDMRLIRKMPHPRFYYEYKGDGALCPHCNQRKAGPQAFRESTEDVTFTRDAAFAGIPLYINWSSWCGHHKMKTVGKPTYVETSRVARLIVEGAEVHKLAEKLNGKPAAPPAAKVNGNGKANEGLRFGPTLRAEQLPGLDLSFDPVKPTLPEERSVDWDGMADSVMGGEARYRASPTTGAPEIRDPEGVWRQVHNIEGMTADQRAACGIQ